MTRLEGRNVDEWPVFVADDGEVICINFLRLAADQGRTLSSFCVPFEGHGRVELRFPDARIDDIDREFYLDGAGDA